jgi:hypothetical protein
MQDLEKDLLFFYDYLLFLKEIKKEDCWLKYTGVYVNALKLLSDMGVEYTQPKKFKDKNYISQYIKLTKMFRLSEFKDNVFVLEEIKLIKNQWRLL